MRANSCIYLLILTNKPMSALTIDSIKDAMGNSMKYCTTEESVVEYNIPLSTLNYGIARGYIYPLKKGRKNVNSR